MGGGCVVVVVVGECGVSIGLGLSWCGVCWVLMVWCGGLSLVLASSWVFMCGRGCGGGVVESFHLGDVLILGGVFCTSGLP